MPCIAWLASVIGFPAEAAGTLTSGGSIANLTAIVAAREARDPDGGGAVYLTRFAHHCVDKALHIAGRGRSPRRHHRRRTRTTGCPSMRSRGARGGSPQRHPALAGRRFGRDGRHRRRSIRCRHRRALRAVTAPGSTSTAPMAACSRLCEEGRARLRGIERADSVALDPHKTLFLPYGTGAALVRDGQLLLDAFSASADYIRPFGETDVGPSPADLSPELTRHFRALRLWLPLQIAGVAAFRAAQAEKLELARYFHARLSAIDGFDAGPAPDLSVVAFRYLPEDRRYRRIQRAADAPHPAGRARDAERDPHRRPLSACAARSFASAPILSMSTRPSMPCFAACEALRWLRWLRDRAAAPPRLGGRRTRHASTRS